MAPIVNVSAGWYNVPGQKYTFGVVKQRKRAPILQFWPNVVVASCVSISALTLPPGSPRSGAPFNERSHEQNIGSRYRGGVAAG